MSEQPAPESSWAAAALRACLNDLAASPSNDIAAAMEFEDAWIEDDDALCIGFHVAGDPAGPRFGLRRHRNDFEVAERRGEYRLGDPQVFYTVGAESDDDPILFGINVSRSDFGEPHGTRADHVRLDEHGVSWLTTPSFP